MGSKAKHESKFIKCMKAPIRILIKARDFYVRSLTDCSGNMNYGSGMGYPAAPLPKSFSVNSSTRSSTSDDDLRELIRAASQRGLREKIEMEIQQQRRQSSKKLPRSFTVGIERIDEEKTCEFEEVTKVKKIELMYPRSKSYAVTKRTGLYSS